MLKREREQIVHYCRLMQSRGLTRGTGGNISIRQGDLIAISPSGVEYETMTPEDVPVVNMDGSVIYGSLAPSSELSMHIACYKRRPDIAAMVHTHSTFAATLACMEKPLPPIHYLIGYAGDHVPCIPYYPFGSEELAAAAADAMTQNALLLGHHGLIAAGPNIERAFAAAEEVEFVAELYWRCQAMGGANSLTPEQMADIRRRFDNYGQGKNTQEEK
ncbi:MAG: class II aldolase/adducin family protein [Clostridia bacterium]|nr:class II aldolase/adducin family protein [Clostridia bacterium]